MENKFGFTSLIIGIFAFIPLIVLFFLPFSEPVGEYLMFIVILMVLITIGIILAGLTIVFGIIGTIKDLRKTMTIIGIVLGCGVLTINIIFLIIVVMI